LLASETVAREEPRFSSPELDAQATAHVTIPAVESQAVPPVVPIATTIPSPAQAISLTAVISTNDVPATTAGGGGGYRGGPGFRQRRYLGPGSASDVVVGKLAPGIARPPVFHQALPEKPATPEEGSLALFTQALFGSAEFRYLQ
jgi:hypothetical protein